MLLLNHDLFQPNIFSSLYTIIIFDISILLASSKLVSQDFFECNNFQTLVTLSSNLLPVKSQAVSALCWIPLFEAVFIASVVDLLALSNSFWLYLLVFDMFLVNDKVHSLLHIFNLWVQLNNAFLK